MNINLTGIFWSAYFVLSILVACFAIGYFGAEQQVTRECQSVDSHIQVYCDYLAGNLH